MIELTTLITDLPCVIYRTLQPEPYDNNTWCF